jgi:hypothetical protein
MAGALRARDGRGTGHNFDFDLQQSSTVTRFTSAKDKLWLLQRLSGPQPPPGSFLSMN